MRRFGTKCAGCSLGISPTDLVRRARSKVFHLKCFTCLVCRKQLSTGEELYVLDEHRFVCKDDYLARHPPAPPSAAGPHPPSAHGEFPWTPPPEAVLAMRLTHEHLISGKYHVQRQIIESKCYASNYQRRWSKY
ncbi:hypothetical protein HPB48_018515 [Haemaphysalis longicornis]|uniref:LIM zinc-binding domain-containing protein n=1 Tax=Haemaphysalis longicornis TaxID=44386 RepID=A0A9J6GUQ3_HAELO|nr:hypothetical protein HPB48_018515 [Haemaphysalis longicornis]